MSADAPERDYDVGYGKTPTHTRFKPGTSGNPSGRKKKLSCPQTMLRDELNRLMHIQEDGKKTRTTKLGVIIKQMTNAAMKGNPKALIEFATKFNFSITEEKEKKTDIDPLDTQEDLKTMESFYKRMRAKT